MISFASSQTITIVAAFCCLTSMGCIGEKKSEEPPAPADSSDAVPLSPPPTSAPVLPLVGNWRSIECTALAAGSWGKDLMVFQDNNVIAARTFYRDDKCKTMVYTATLQGKYVSGAANPNGGTNLDLLYNQQTATFPDQTEAKQALAGYSSGPNALCKDGAQPVASGSIIDLTLCSSRQGALYQYSVYSVTGTQLHLAVPSSDSATAEKGPNGRVVKFDSALVLSKN